MPSISLLERTLCLRSATEVASLDAAMVQSEVDKRDVIRTRKVTVLNPEERHHDDRKQLLQQLLS